MLQIYLVVCNVLYKLTTCHAMKQSEMVWNYFLNICLFLIWDYNFDVKKIQTKNITSDQNGTHDFKIFNSTHFQLVTKQEKQNLTLYFQLYLFLPTLQFATPINIFITLFYNKFTVNHHRIKNYCVVFGLTFTFLQGLKKLHTSSENCNVIFVSIKGYIPSSC